MRQPQQRPMRKPMPHETMLTASVPHETTLTAAVPYETMLPSVSFSACLPEPMLPREKTLKGGFCGRKKNDERRETPPRMVKAKASRRCGGLWPSVDWLSPCAEDLCGRIRRKPSHEGQAGWRAWRRVLASPTRPCCHNEIYPPRMAYGSHRAV